MSFETRLRYQLLHRLQCLRTTYAFDDTCGLYLLKPVPNQQVLPDFDPALPVIHAQSSY